MHSLIRPKLYRAPMSMKPLWRWSGSLAPGLDDLLTPSRDEKAMKPIVVKYGDHAFQINNTLVRQSVMLLPNSFLLWNARTFEDITIKSLSVFTTLYPTVEIVFVGCGERMPRPISPEIVKHFRRRGIIIEATSTMNAASTYNILSAEGRNVAAALLTPLPPNSDYTGLRE
mmetsp:Transcript_42754/g.84897  ORF Transcript_42754/g.84897 Transcript_42754/m.84897 type:complete len:171 (-) Transcript_42754:138-650(-)